MPLFGNVFAAQPATTAVNNEQLTVNNAPAAEPQTAPAKPVRPANDEDTVAIRYEYDYYMSDFEYEQAKLGNWEPWNESCRKQKAAEPKNAPAEPAPTPKAQTKTEPTTKIEYVAPASPQEAHDRIETAATAVPAKITKQQQGDQYIFGGKTFSLRQAFTMLGGTFDKQSQSWSISVERYDNPALCQDTFDAEIARNERRNERIEAHKEEIEAIKAQMRTEFSNELINRSTEQIRNIIAEDVAKARKQWEQERTPAGMISLADAQAATKKAMTLMLAALSKTPEASIDAIIKKAYSA